MTAIDFLRWMLTGKMRTETERCLRAAERGKLRAQIQMGLRYEQGRGVPQNPREAARWFRLAAQQGNPEAEFYLGRAHRTGKGAPKDCEFAYAFFERAAKKGHEKAAEWLAALAREMTPEQIAEGETLSKEAVGRI